MNARPGSSQALSWFACAAIALGVHLGWFLILPAMPQRAAATVPAAPRVALMPDTLQDVRADVRLVWSPLLFAVPSTRGFSESLLQERIAFAPSAQGSALSPFLAGRSEPPSGAGLTDGGTSLARVISAALSTLPLRPADAPAFKARPAETSVVLYIAWTDPSGAVRNVSVDVGPVDPWVDTRPWLAEAMLDIDAAGSVTHVFLEKPTALKDRNAALARILAVLRFDPAPAHSSRVTVRYEGTYQPREAASR